MILSSLHHMSCICQCIHCTFYRILWWYLFHMIHMVLWTLLQSTWIPFHKFHFLYFLSFRQISWFLVKPVSRPSVITIMTFMQSRFTAHCLFEMHHVIFHHSLFFLMKWCQSVGSFMLKNVMNLFKWYRHVFLDALNLIAFSKVSTLHCILF